ncbi:MAG TPA: hypothetical protein VGR00_11140, partial [Thermoanaerobaculia bacterium]|nr:hypothetical protein [Thermoanaerobaculia bacterium]
MNRATFVLAAATALVVALVVNAEPPRRHPMAEKAEASFFALLNDSQGSPSDVLRDLTTAYAIDPTDARTLVLLGLDHLWMAAEGDQRDPMTIQHLVLADHFFARAQDVNPQDDRIPSWLGPTRLILAG